MRKKMKKIKIIGIVLAALIILSIGFYTLFLVPVEPPVVCNNMFKLAKVHLEENGVAVSDEQIEKLVGMNLERCIKKTEFKYRNTTDSFLNVTSHSKCVADANTWSELKQCSTGG